MVTRFRQKMRIRKKLKANRMRRSADDAFLEPYFSSLVDAPEINSVLDDMKHRRKERRSDSLQRRGKGFRSPYKLTGLGKTKEWDEAVRRKIEEKGGDAAAEKRALEKWLKKPRNGKRLEKHGKR